MMRWRRERRQRLSGPTGRRDNWACLLVLAGLLILGVGCAAENQNAGQAVQAAAGAPQVQKPAAKAERKPKFVGSTIMAAPKPKPKPAAAAQAKPGAKKQSLDDLLAEEEAEEEPLVQVADPLEPWNRFWFCFNDVFYRHVVNPVARGYKAAVPGDYRSAVQNFFHNLFAPVRFFSALLQGKIDTAGRELARFMINTTMGVLGFGDAATEIAGIEQPDDEDFGQTLASWGIGNGFYIVWPIIGPSTLRDSVGLVGDMMASPVWDLKPFEAALGVRSYQYLNDASFRIGDYESLTDPALDPYTAVRNFYLQYRAKKVQK